MFVVPKSEITIGSVRFYGEQAGVNAVTIKESVDSLGNSATVTIPRNFQRKDGKGILDYIHTGDKATIRLGYGDNLYTEFEGYLAHIGDGTPIVLEIEDEWYLFRKTRFNKNFQSTSLKDVLQFVFPGYTIDDNVNSPIPEGYTIRDASAYDVVKALHEQRGFFTRVDVEKKTVSCFYPFNYKGVETHTYVFGTRNCTLLDELRKKELAPNIISNTLKFVRKEDIKLHITAKGQDRAGKTIVEELGDNSDDATKRTMNFGTECQTKQALRERAQAALDKQCFDGYEGKITGFGVPRVHAGDAVKLVDPENSEREGIYLVKAVTINYGVGTGFRREVELSYKI